MLRLLLTLLLLMPALAARAAPAVLVPNLYVGEVVVGGESEAERGNALRAALARVLVRVTGDAGVTARGIEGLISGAGRYVQSYRYLRRERPDGTPELLLRANFDEQGLSRAIREYGLPMWPQRRAQTLLWFAALDETGERLLLDEAAARARFPGLFDAAAARGLPLAFPLLDLEDASAVEFTDVWAGFVEPVERASQRYDVHHAALLRLEAGAGRWQCALTALAPEREPLYWSFEAADPEAALAMALGAYSDTLAERYVVAGGSGWVRDLRLRVSGISDLAGYARVREHLASLGPVQSVSTDELSGQGVAFRVRFEGEQARLVQSIALGRVLVEAPDEPAATPPVDGGGLSVFAIGAAPELRYRLR